MVALVGIGQLQACPRSPRSPSSPRGSQRAPEGCGMLGCSQRSDGCVANGGRPAPPGARGDATPETTWKRPLGRFRALDGRTLCWRRSILRRSLGLSAFRRFWLAIVQEPRASLSHSCVFLVTEINATLLHLFRLARFFSLVQLASPPQFGLAHWNLCKARLSFAEFAAKLCCKRSTRDIAQPFCYRLEQNLHTLLPYYASLVPFTTQPLLATAASQSTFGIKC